MKKIMEIRNLVKSFGRKDYESQVLKGINLDIQEQDFVAIMGPSGAGKSTLLNMLSTLDKPTRGQIFLDGEDVTKADNKRLSIIRRDKIGFIFQEYNLLDNMTLEDNIALPLSLNGVKSREVQKRVTEYGKALPAGGASVKIPLPALRRAETERGKCPGPDHGAKDYLCR